MVLQKIMGLKKRIDVNNKFFLFKMMPGVLKIIFKVAANQV